MIGKKKRKKKKNWKSTTPDVETLRRDLFTWSPLNRFIGVRSFTGPTRYTIMTPLSFEGITSSLSVTTAHVHPSLKTTGHTSSVGRHTRPWFRTVVTTKTPVGKQSSVLKCQPHTAPRVRP